MGRPEDIAVMVLREDIRMRMTNMGKKCLEMQGSLAKGQDCFYHGNLEGFCPYQYLNKDYNPDQVNEYRCRLKD